MKKIILSILIIMSLQMEGKAERFDMEMNFPDAPCTLRLSGTIDSTLGVYMQLSRSGYQLEGSYAYEKYQKDIVITGILSEDGQITLFEYGNGQDGDQVTGTFEGNFVSPNRIEGRWRNPAQTREYPFILERASIVILTGVFDDGQSFHVRAAPLYDEKQWAADEIMLYLQDIGTIPLWGQDFWQTCGRADGGIDLNSIEIQTLHGDPTLIAIAWATRPIARTLGERCLLVVPQHHIDTPFFEECLSSSFTQSDFEGGAFSTIRYTHKTLSIEVVHSYRKYFSETGITEEGERELVCSYEVSTEGLTFLDADGRSRTTRSETMSSWQSLQNLREEDCNSLDWFPGYWQQ